MARTSSFTAAMRRHAAGVCTISVGAGEEVNGMAATAVTSLSATPPAMLVCVNRSASICADLSLGARFRLTILGSLHAFVARAFSRKPSCRARFEHGTWLFEPGDLPLMEDAPANISCRVERMVAYGTHVA